MKNVSCILLVEDEEPLGRAFKISLTRAGYTTHWVVSGEEAVSWLTTHSPQLVLLDLRLPGMEGMEVLEHIHGTHPQTPVIIMSAHGDLQTVARAMKLGAANYLSKPVDLNEMTRIIERHLQIATKEMAE